MIEPPDGQVRESLANMYRAADWKGLLLACESRVPQYLFWLDLSRYVVEALEQTGNKAVADEVAGLTLVYARRLPGIERLSFSDGTPFAESETRQWLDRMEKGRPGGPGEKPAPDKDLVRQIEEEMAQARAKARGGDLREAAMILGEKLREAPSARERCIRQALFCRFLIDSQQHRLFDAYLRDLVKTMEACGAEEWEPALAARIYSILLTTIESAGREDYREIGDRVMARLSLLDPMQAMDHV